MKKTRTNPAKIMMGDMHPMDKMRMDKMKMKRMKKGMKKMKMGY